MVSGCLYLYGAKSNLIQGQKIHKDEAVDQNLEFWQNLKPSAKLAGASSLEQTIDMAEGDECQKPRCILVTGSTHLVGQALTLLAE